MRHIKKYSLLAESYKGLTDQQFQFLCKVAGGRWIYNKKTKRVDLYDSISFGDEKFTRFPVNFGVVEGYFDCSYVGLVTLEGAPTEVSESFLCNNNHLKSLIGGPMKAKKYNCSYNDLTNLDGGPEEVESFNCKYNLITTLNDSKLKNVIDFDCGHNKLTSLVGSPEKCDFFECEHNELINLVGGPSEVKKQFSCFNNNLISLKGVGKIGEIDERERINNIFSCVENPDLISIEDFNSEGVRFFFDVSGTFRHYVKWDNNGIDGFQYRPDLFAPLINNAESVLLQFSKNLPGLSRIYDRLKPDIREKVLKKLNITANELSGIRNADKFGLF